MVQKTSTRDKSLETWIGPCSPSGARWKTNSVTEYDHTVVSERRVKPKGGDFLPPNDFRVEKFTILNPADSTLTYTLSENGVCNLKMSGHRACYSSTPRTFEEFPAQPGPLEELYEEATSTAERDVFAKANAPAVFDSAPMIYELGETLAYCGLMLKSLVEIFKTAKFAGGFLKLLRSPESMWLQYRYAIMPLILTVSDVIEAFKGGVQKTTYDARVELEVQHPRLHVRTPYLSGYLNDVHEMTDVVTATARLYVKAQCDPHPLGFGLLDQVRGLWEIVPLSFVFDWFVGVGDWLTSIRNTELELLGSYSTTVVDRTGSLRLHGEGSLLWSPTPVTEWKHYVMNRKTDIVPPHHPILQVEKLSILRTADAITLTIAILKGILNSWGKK